MAKIDEKLHEKLAAVGLLEPRIKRDKMQLLVFIDSYIESRTDVKPATRDLMRQARRFLVDCFGAGKP